MMVIKKKRLDMDVGDWFSSLDNVKVSTCCYQQPQNVAPFFQSHLPLWLVSSYRGKQRLADMNLKGQSHEIT
jgi:hypothetical protein